MPLLQTRRIPPIQQLQFFIHQKHTHININKRWLTQIQNSKFNILYMGRDEFSCGVFQQLYNAPDVWSQITIATHPDEKVGRRGSVLAISPLKELGNSLSVPVHTIPAQKSAFRQWTLPSPFQLPSKLELESQTPPQAQPQPPSNHLLITASFGRILPLSMLSQFSKQNRLNVHPSLLPCYRGPAPIQHALMKGEKETGVCVIGMLPVKKKGGEGGIDAGDIWGSRSLSVPEDAEFTKMRNILAIEGGKLLVDVLRGMIGGTAKAISQPIQTNEPHAPMITQADWTINFSELTAQEIVWRHRAISHQRHLTTTIATTPPKTVQIITPGISIDPKLDQNLSMKPGSARLCKSSTGNVLLIRCKDNTVLEVSRLKQEGKKETSAKEWWNGVKGMGIVNTEGHIDLY